MEKSSKSPLCMSRKKLALIVIMVMLATLAMERVANNMLKPFRFENFATAEELQKFLEERYPKGSRIEYLSDDLEKAGGKGCGVLPESTNNPLDSSIQYSRAFACGYHTDLLSLSWFESFGIYVFTDNENNILEIKVYKFYGIKA